MLPHNQEAKVGGEGDWGYLTVDDVARRLIDSVCLPQVEVTNILIADIKLKVC